MTVEGRSCEFSAIALNLADAVRQDTVIDGPGRQCPGLVVAHLDEFALGINGRYVQAGEERGNPTQGVGWGDRVVMNG